MPAKNLGIYFGKDTLSLAEVEGKRITAQVSLPLEQGVTADAAVDEVKLAAVLGGALRERRIGARKAFLGLSHRNQFIRGFQMLLLKQAEMNSGVLFEVRKYIPFKTEDLVFDYQRRVNKKTAKMDILFVAATRSSLDGYLSVLGQAGLKASAVEPASFALLRVLSLTQQLDHGLSFALVSLKGADAELTIVDKGFPCFSRDITLPQVKEAGDTNSIDEPQSVRGRLSSEIRVSLDYFRRQFSGNPVDRVLFLSKDFSRQEELVLGLSEDLGLPVERVALEKDSQTQSAKDLDMLKAYALALKGTVKLNLTVDLAKKKLLQPVIEDVPKDARRQLALNISAINIGQVIKWPLVVALGLAIAAFALPQSRLYQAGARLSQMRQELEGSLLAKFKGLDFESWKSSRTDYQGKIETIEKLVKSRFAFTPSLNVLPGALMEGLWLENISMAVREGRTSILIKGTAYLGERGAEVDSVNTLYKALKGNKDFMRGLRNLELKSLNEGQAYSGESQYTVTQFEILGS
ncbi:hypothetical protein EPN16_07190 [bacterium]|nr:MAG: hypothetical protein EPN16_07190 [bacterium]